MSAKVIDTLKIILLIQRIGCFGGSILPLVDLQVVALSVVPDTESKISFSVFPYKMFTISSLLLQLSKEREVKCNGSLHINVGQPTLPMGSRQSLFQAEDLKQQMCIFSNF